MKTFAQYLVESEKTFDYRIKIVGDVSPEFLKQFKDQLKKFEPASIGEVKTTPIVAQPQGFPGYPNHAVNMIDVSFKYPATPPQIEQVAELLGLSADRISMNTIKWQEGMDKELLGIADQKDLLTSEYPPTDAEQKRIKKDYAAAAQDKEVVKNSASQARFTVAGGKTPPAKTTNDLPQGIKSPMSNVKRPAKPATGKQPQGN
jgi:hypothetical protein